MNPKSKATYSKHIGTKFGSLYIQDLIYDINASGRSRYKYVCKCDCGNTKNIPCWYILCRNTKTCGCARYRTKVDYTQYIGKRFGKLVITDLVRMRRNKDIQKKLYFIANCDCGKTNHYMYLHSFFKHKCRSCGCSVYDNALKNNKKLIGKQFNDLTVIDAFYEDKKLLLKCECTCGTEIITTREKLLNNTIRYCGTCYSNYHNLLVHRQVLELCKKQGYELLSEWNGLTTQISSDSKSGFYPKYNRYQFKCLKCNSIFEKSFSPDSNFVCPHCMEEYSSYTEFQMAKFLKKYNIKFYKTYISSLDQSINQSLELDFYLPDYNFAIEINGLQTHCTYDYVDLSKSYARKSKHKKYHLNKTLSAYNKNITLIHIWETEIFDEDKFDIIKSMLLHKTKNSLYRTYARKCYVREIDKSVAIQFLNNHHLQGSSQGDTVCLGLYYKSNNKLVSVMTFGSSRYNLKYEWELRRFANFKYTHIVGSASKLFTYFIRNYVPKSIISYCNIRIFGIDNHVYDILGFKYDHHSEPCPWYFEHYRTTNKKLYHRSHFQKHKLKKLFENFDPNITASENIENNNWLKVYDCGSYVYYWNKI